MHSPYEWFGRPDAPVVVFVVDLNDGGRNVTNDIENVVADLLREAVLKLDDRLVYRDSMEIWDEMRLDGECRFTGIQALCVETPEKAIRKLVD